MAIILILILLLGSGFTTADEFNPSIPHQIPETSTKIVLDGTLTEGEWDNAFSAPLNFEREPSINGAPLVETIIYITHDKNTLYVAFRCFEPNPESIRAQIADREQIFDDDGILLHLDTFNDKRTHLCFGANPYGIQLDGTAENRNFDWSWDAIWDCEGAIHDWGWSLEMAIPFDQLRLPRTSGKQIWRIDAWRSHPRNAEHKYSLAPLNPDSNCYECDMVEIEGFAGVEQGQNIELNPTFTAVNTARRNDPSGGDYETVKENANVGLTGKWGVTPNITASATLNPDFSQIEADSRQLDINNTFALYYREKRPFFLEGNSYFSSPMINTYYSRSFRDPVYGAKVAGKEGRHSFGVMYVEDEVTNVILPGAQGSSGVTLPGNSQAAVGRYSYDLNDRYTLGAMVTHRTGEGDYQNSTYGVDGIFRITDTDSIEVQYIGSSTEDSTGIGENIGRFDDAATYLVYRHREKNWYAMARRMDYGADFRADTGFVPQVDFVNYMAMAGYIWIPDEKSWYNKINLEFQYQSEETQSGESLTKRGDIFGLITLPYMQSVVASRYFLSEQTYLGHTFDVTYFGTYKRMTPSDFCTLELDTSFGDTIDYRNVRLADRLRLQPMITLRLGARLNLYAEHEFERLSHEGEEIYTANITQATLRYLFNRRTMLRGTLQYVDYQYNPEKYVGQVDEEFQHLFTQFLFSYKINPRTVLFLGYSDNYRGNQNFDVVRQDYTFFAKIGYAWQL